MKRIPATMRLLAILALTVPLLIGACESETVGPVDEPPTGGDLETLQRISASNFEDKTTVSQGFAGTVFDITNGEWAIGGFVIEDASPAQAEVGVYQYEGGDSIYTFAVPNLIAQERRQTDADGFYQFELEIGSYMVLVSNDPLPDTLSFMNLEMYDYDMGGVIEPAFGFWFNDDLLMTEVTVIADSVRKIDFYLQPPMEWPDDPWWPPMDTTGTDTGWWPPPDTAMWPPDDTLFWPPTDSSDVYFQYELLLRQNREKVTIDSGVYGTTTQWRGDFMPVYPSGTFTPMPYTIRVHEAVMPGSEDADFYADGTMYASVINTPLVEEVTADEDGFYQFELPPGEYSVVAVVAPDSLLFGWDMMFGWDMSFDPYPVPFPPGALEAGDIHEVNFEEWSNTTW